jgi:hypothetical protein
MAVGKPADPLFALLDELGDDENAKELMITELCRWLSGDEIKDFVESFRQNYEL